MMEEEKKLWGRNLENVLLRTNDVERRKKNHLKEKKSLRDSRRKCFIIFLFFLE